MSEEPIDTALLAGFSPVEPQRQKCLPSAVKASQARESFGNEISLNINKGGGKMIFSPGHSLRSDRAFVCVDFAAPR
jgi:hypothetical protein